MKQYKKYLAGRDTRVETSVIGVYRRDVQMGFHIAVGRHELSNLQTFPAVEFFSVKLPRDVGSGVAGRDALESQGGAGSEGLFAEAVADLWWFN